MNKIILLNFIELSLSNKKIVLFWRNHGSIKKWMFNSLDISLEEHLSFIESLMNSKTKLYFLVKQNNNFLGVIDFTNINKNSAEFGLYTNPKIKGKGEILLKTICDYAFKELKIRILYAEAFIDNIRAIELYKKFNFLETKIKIIQKKEVICMELKNENW